jgi:hypothetical protein
MLQLGMARGTITSLIDPGCQFLQDLGQIIHPPSAFVVDLVKIAV